MKKNKSNISRKLSSSDSFLESLRDLGGDFYTSFKDNLIKSGAKDIYNAFNPFTNYINHEEGKKNPVFPEQKIKPPASRIEIIRKEEKILFLREQKEIQNQVSSLQEEIKKLAQTTAQLASEIKQAEITAMQETPITGKYHLNFFNKLKEIIIKIRSQIQESSFWLAAWNQKAQKRNYYWRQFKSSGSKFLLSSDRYVATQAG